MSPRRKSLSERAFVFGDGRNGDPESEPPVSPPDVEALLPLEEIQERYLGDSREVDPSHVADLAESIAALGLIEPLVVDSKHRLLAGGHRLAAIGLLKETQPQRYAERFPQDLVPIQVMGFDSATDPNLALAIEAAENEKRRDYTTAEIKALAEKLRQAGYEDVRGRPRQGQKPLMPALSVVVGKSLRTVQRHLYGQTAAAQSATDDGHRKQQLLKQALTRLRQWQAMELDGDEEKLARQVSKFTASLEKFLAGRD